MSRAKVLPGVLILVFLTMFVIPVQAYPPAGYDNISTSATVYFYDPVDTTVLAEVISLTGDAVIWRGDEFDPGDGRMKVLTYLDTLMLRGYSASMGDSVYATIDRSRDTAWGFIQQVTPGIDFPAESFFDIFYKITIGAPAPAPSPPSVGGPGPVQGRLHYDADAGTGDLSYIGSSGKASVSASQIEAMHDVHGMPPVQLEVSARLLDKPGLPKDESTRIDTCVNLWYYTAASYFWEVPDANGIPEFGVRFTPDPASCCTLSEVSVYVYEAVIIGQPDMQVTVYSDNVGLPGTALCSITVPYADLVFYPGVTLIDFSSCNLIFCSGAEFHVGVQRVGGAGDILSILSDEGLNESSRSWAQWDGAYYPLIDLFGVYWEFLIEAYVCCGDTATVCSVTCPAGSTVEDEPCGTDVNGGCNSAVPSFTLIQCGETVCGTAWADIDVRDTDWYRLVLTQSVDLTWSVEAESNLAIFMVAANSEDCLDYTILASTTAGPCTTATVSATVPPGVYWLLAMPSVFDGYPCATGPHDYVGTVTCVPNQVTWINPDSVHMIDTIFQIPPHGRVYKDPRKTPIVNEAGDTIRWAWHEHIVEPPPAGEDTIPTTGWMDVWVGPNPPGPTQPPDEVIRVDGNAVIARADAEHFPEGGYMVQTEILSMDLAGESVLFGPTILSLPFPASGQSYSTGSEFWPVESFFDVYYQIDFPALGQSIQPLDPPIMVTENPINVFPPEDVNLIDPNPHPVHNIQNPGIVIGWVRPIHWLPPRQDSTGACCDQSNGDCRITTAANCDPVHETYSGNGTTCTPNLCPVPDPDHDCFKSVGQGTITLDTADTQCANGIQLSLSSILSPDTKIEFDPPPYHDGGTIETEMIQMELSATDPGLGLVIVRERSDKASTGAIENVVTDGQGNFVSGESYFDLFLEVEFPDLGLLLNTGNSTLRMEATVYTLPPDSAYFPPPAAPPLPLYDAATGQFMGWLCHAEHQPGIVIPCDEPRGACCDMASGDCRIDFVYNCNGPNDVYQGDNSSCVPNPCVVLDCDLPYPGGFCLDGLTGPGAGSGNSIICDLPFTFNIRETNISGQMLTGQANGFRVYSPDGACWTPITTDTAGGLASYYNLGVFLQTYSITGCGADTVGLAAVAISGGLPDGYSEVVLEVTTQVSAADSGLTLCIDSSFYPPGNTWTWIDQASNPIIPNWDGPHCFAICTPGNPCPTGWTAGVDTIHYSNFELDLFNPADSTDSLGTIVAYGADMIVQRSTPYLQANNKWRMDTEVLQFTGSGGSAVLGPITIDLDPSQTSTGYIEQCDSCQDNPAYSTFSIHYLIGTSLAPPMHELSGTAEMELDCSAGWDPGSPFGPPTLHSYFDPRIVPVYDASGQIAGYVRKEHRLGNASPCTQWTPGLDSIPVSTMEIEYYDQSQNLLDTLIATGGLMVVERLAPYEVAPNIWRMDTKILEFSGSGNNPLMGGPFQIALDPSAEWGGYIQQCDSCDDNWAMSHFSLGYVIVTSLPFPMDTIGGDTAIMDLPCSAGWNPGDPFEPPDGYEYNDPRIVPVYDNAGNLIGYVVKKHRVGETPPQPNCELPEPGGMCLDGITGPGANGPGQVLCNQPFTFNLRMTNLTGQALNGSTNGFRVYSPEGACWTPITYDTAGGLDQYYDLIVATQAAGITGCGADSVGVGGATLFGPGVPPGYSEVILEVTTSVDAAEAGKTLCIDSAFIPPSFSWLWQHPSGGTTIPLWDGPHCVTICDGPEPCPTGWTPGIDTIQYSTFSVGVFNPADSSDSIGSVVAYGVDMVVQRYTPYQQPNGKWRMDTEVIQFSGAGGSDLFGPITIDLDPSQASLGYIEQCDSCSDSSAYSEFAIHYRINTSLAPPEHEITGTAEMKLECSDGWNPGSPFEPPNGRSYNDPRIVPVYDASGQVIGYTRKQHRVNNTPPCTHWTPGLDTILFSTFEVEVYDPADPGVLLGIMVAYGTEMIVQRGAPYEVSPDIWRMDTDILSLTGAGGSAIFGPFTIALDPAQASGGFIEQCDSCDDNWARSKFNFGYIITTSLAPPEDLFIGSAEMDLPCSADWNPGDPFGPPNGHEYNDPRKVPVYDADSNIVGYVWKRHRISDEPPCTHWTPGLDTILFSTFEVEIYDPADPAVLLGTMVAYGTEMVVQRGLPYETSPNIWRMDTDILSLTGAGGSAIFGPFTVALDPDQPSGGFIEQCDSCSDNHAKSEFTFGYVITTTLAPPEDQFKGSAEMKLPCEANWNPGDPFEPPNDHEYNDPRKVPVYDADSNIVGYVWKRHRVSNTPPCTQWTPGLDTIKFSTFEIEFYDPSDTTSPADTLVAYGINMVVERLAPFEESPNIWRMNTRVLEFSGSGVSPILGAFNIDLPSVNPPIPADFFIRQCDSCNDNWAESQLSIVYIITTNLAPPMDTIQVDTARMVLPCSVGWDPGDPFGPPNGNSYVDPRKVPIYDADGNIIGYIWKRHRVAGTANPDVGACCFGPDECVLATQIECQLAEGDFKGPGSRCEPEDPCTCCNHDGIRGDLDGSGSLDVADLTFIVDYLFRGGFVPECFEEADVDGSGGIDVADLTYIVDYLFNGGLPPLPCILE